jgi:hypothetical protein
MYEENVGEAGRIHIFVALAPSKKWLMLLKASQFYRLVGLYNESELEPPKEPCQMGLNKVFFL